MSELHDFSLQVNLPRNHFKTALVVEVCPVSSLFTRQGLLIGLGLGLGIGVGLGLANREISTYMIGQIRYQSSYKIV